MKNKPISLFFILSMAGFLISLYLLIPYLTDSSVSFCPIGSHTDGVSGCDVVKDSQYSQILGIPLPVFGIIFYLFIFGYNAFHFFAPKIITSIEKLSPLNSKIFPLDSIAIILGFISSLYLTSLEAFVIHDWCFWCVSQAIIASVLFVLTAFLFWIKPNLKKLG